MPSSSERCENDRTAHYVFAVRFRVESADPDLSLDPATFETKLRRRADPPGERGWLFFRANLWRGEVNEEADLRRRAMDALGIPVETVEFRELRTDRAYLDALEDEVAANLELFRADDVPAVLTKYLGSAIRVVDLPPD